MRVIILFCIALVTVNALPFKDVALIPDGNGHFHYVDFKSNFDEVEPEPVFNGAEDMEFRLFTRSNAATPQILQILNAESILNSNFQPNHPTRFVIHGWNNNGNSDVNILIRNAYLNHGEFNVIVVDWARGANTVNYLAARNRVSIVGSAIGRLLDWMNGALRLNLSTVYLIGHSLGAHAAGMAGKQLFTKDLDTIIALDPALPLFSIDSPNQRVDSNDAKYVEVIHTNSGLLGFDLPIGHTDFYPNGGREQPGCIADIAGACAHGREFEFFAESIQVSSRFTATQCASYSEIFNSVCTPSGPNRDMGSEPSNRIHAARGIFFLTTNSRTPFARG